MKKHRVNIVCAVNAANVSKDGERYTVKDVVHAIDGIVLNQRLYPGDELQKAANGLEGRPAPAGHPRDSKGRHISAANGEALSAAWVGAWCVNARYEGGRALCDIVINAAQAQALEPGRELLARLDAAIAGTNTEPIAVSSGLMLREVAANGESRGKAYRAVATDLQFDHLAILLNETPAGTPAEGIGMFVNADGTESAVEHAALVFNEADAAAAEKKLRDAIELHQKHMDGTEPTTGPEGDKSQMKMMRMMKAAFAALTGKAYGSKGGMAMNVAMATADRRHEGLSGWLRRLVSNGSELSFDQIERLIRRVLPEGAWPVEVYARHLVWVDQSNKLWRQDYALASDGSSVALQGEPAEVVRRVEYQPVTNSQEKDVIKEMLVAALNAAGIQTEGKNDAQLVEAYNAHVGANAVKPVSEQLAAVNGELKGFKDAAAAAETRARDELVTKLATNSAGLTADELKLLPVATLQKMAGNTQAAAPVVVGNTQKQTGEFAGYDLNAINEVK